MGIPSLFSNNLSKSSISRFLPDSMLGADGIFLRCFIFLYTTKRIPKTAKRTPTAIINVKEESPSVPERSKERLPEGVGSMIINIKNSKIKPANTAKDRLDSPFFI